MSYDLLLLHREPGQSWDEVLAASERLASRKGTVRSARRPGEVGADRRPPASP